MISGVTRPSFMSRLSLRSRRTKWTSFLNLFLGFSLARRYILHFLHVLDCSFCYLKCPQTGGNYILHFVFFRKVLGLSTMSSWGRLTRTPSTWLRTGSLRRPWMLTPLGTTQSSSWLRWASCGGRWSSAQTRPSLWHSKVWRQFPLFKF